MDKKPPLYSRIIFGEVGRCPKIIREKDPGGV